MLFLDQVERVERNDCPDFIQSGTEDITISVVFGDWLWFASFSTSVLHTKRDANRHSGLPKVLCEAKLNTRDKPLLFRAILPSAGSCVFCFVILPNPNKSE